MTTEALIEGDAAAAVSTLMRLGNRGVSFDRRRVLHALASARGRARLAVACLRRPARFSAPSVPRVARRARQRAFRRLRASGRVATGSREPAPPREGV